MICATRKKSATRDSDECFTHRGAMPHERGCAANFVVSERHAPLVKWPTSRNSNSLGNGPICFPWPIFGCVARER